MLNNFLENKMIIKNNSKITIRDLKPNEEKEVCVDDFGTIKDKYWRRRQKDNDGNLEFIKKEIKKIKNKKGEE